MKKLECGSETMTVGELIEKLKVFPDDMPVMLTDDWMHDTGIRAVSTPDSPDEDFGHWGDEKAVYIASGDDPY